MTINLSTSQTTLFISIVFILMASTLGALKFIISSRDSWNSYAYENNIMPILNKLIKITIVISLSLFVLTFILYNN